MCLFLKVFFSSLFNNCLCSLCVSRKTRPELSILQPLGLIYQFWIHFSMVSWTYYLTNTPLSVWCFHYYISCCILIGSVSSLALLYKLPAIELGFKQPWIFKSSLIQELKWSPSLSFPLVNSLFSKLFCSKAPSGSKVSISDTPKIILYAPPKATDECERDAFLFHEKLGQRLGLTPTVPDEFCIHLSKWEGSLKEKLCWVPSTSLFSPEIWS